MALKSTIFKAELQIADMDRGHYDTHALTLAQHPSENDERMMVRLLAYALHAEGEGQEALAFANAMTDMDEPDTAPNTVQTAMLVCSRPPGNREKNGARAR